MGVKEWYSKGKYTSINDLNVFFINQGKGPTLLCIHGFPSSSWDFNPIWTDLIQSFNAITFDLVGLGKSAKPKTKIPVSLQADIIEGLLQKLNVNEAHILAHDLGDTIAQELLARQVEGVSKIKWLSCIFMNGGIFPETHRPLLIQKLLISSFGSIVSRLFSIKAFRKNMNKVFSESHPPSEEFIKGTWDLIVDNEGIKAIPRLIRYMSEREINRERWVNPLINSKIPLRLINGIDDPISGAHMADRYKEVVPNADIIRIANSGHYPHVETPTEVLLAITDFHTKPKF